MLQRRLDGSGLDIIGKVLASEPPTRLLITFADPGNAEPEGGPSLLLETSDVLPQEPWTMAPSNGSSCMAKS